MNKNINCDVYSCLYNNTEEGNCILDDLSISSLGRGSECEDSSSTICQSFERSGGIITDNEYEVSSEFIDDSIDTAIEKEASN